MYNLINKIIKVFNLQSKWKSKLMKLKECRENKSRDVIIDNFINKGYDLEFSTAIVDFVLNYLPVENFPILLEDDLLEDYEIDEEDLGDFFEKTLKQKSICIPSRKEQDVFFTEYSKYPVELAVKFLTWCRDRNYNSTDI